MHHLGLQNHLKNLCDKFKIDKKNQGDSLTITFSGAKEDIAMLDKKLDALHVLTEDCCLKDCKCC